MGNIPPLAIQQEAEEWVSPGLICDRAGKRGRQANCRRALQL